jgi:hypothetical protein
VIDLVLSSVHGNGGEQFVHPYGSRTTHRREGAASATLCGRPVSRIDDVRDQRPRSWQKWAECTACRREAGLL